MCQFWHNFISTTLTHFRNNSRLNFLLGKPMFNCREKVYTAARNALVSWRIHTTRHWLNLLEACGLLLFIALLAQSPVPVGVGAGFHGVYTCGMVSVMCVHVSLKAYTMSYTPSVHELSWLSALYAASGIFLGSNFLAFFLSGCFNIVLSWHGYIFCQEKWGRLLSWWLTS